MRIYVAPEFLSYNKNVMMHARFIQSIARVLLLSQNTHLHEDINIIKIQIKHIYW